MSLLRLNEFQRLMKSWAKMGAYNAGDAMRVSCPLDVARWNDALRAVWSETDFGFPCEPPVILPMEIYNGDLEGAISDQLNLPFESTAPPLRFFLLDALDGSHWFGTMFDHWLVDGYSIRQWMRRCLLRFIHPDGAALPPLRFRNPRSAFSHRWFLGAVECARLLMANRRAFRVWLNNPANVHCGFLRAADVGVDAVGLHARAKGWDVTVNDIFLAVIARVLGERTAAARRAATRDEIGMAVAIDMRRFLDETARGEGGCFLSYFSVAVPSPERSMETLAREISTRTARAKTLSAASRAFSGLGLARRVWDHWPGRKELLMHKALATLAGISNVNLTGSWIEQQVSGSKGGPRDYVRVSPTGPVPLIFTPTTLNGRVALGLTYRRAAFSDNDAREIARSFTSELLAILG